MRLQRALEAVLFLLFGYTLGSLQLNLLFHQEDCRFDQSTAFGRFDKSNSREEEKIVEDIPREINAKALFPQFESIVDAFVPKSIDYVSWGTPTHLQWCLPNGTTLRQVYVEKIHSEATPLLPKHPLSPNQILVAHARPTGARANFSVNGWEKRIVEDGKPGVGVTNVGLYLMADETNDGHGKFSSLLEPYRRSIARPYYQPLNRPHPFQWVIRDYYFEHLKDAPNTTVIPLGTMTCKRKQLLCDFSPPKTVFSKLLAPGVGPGNPIRTLRNGLMKQASQRSRRCFYAGSDRTDRQAIRQHFNRTGSCEVHLTPGFNKGLPRSEYLSILQDTVFGLVPKGNSFETHRLAELIIQGVIPVMVEEDAIAEHMLSYPERIPVVAGPTWAAAEEKMNSMTNDSIDEMQRNVFEWWERYHVCAQADMKWILAQGRALSEGGNLCTTYRQLESVLQLSHDVDQ